MKVLAIVVFAGLLAVAGCGSDDEQPAAGGQQSDTASEQRDAEDAPSKRKDAADAAKRRGSGTKVSVAGSQFGTMLFDSKQQAIYIFERDAKGKSVCSGDCAKAWPPVLTEGEPAAGKGVKGGLLGTIKRRDGRRQVTYAGKPLYYYAHEAPGEVRCHNVDLNGGYWWVVGPDGKRRA